MLGGSDEPDRKGLGRKRTCFNLCVAPCPMLSPYFGSGRLRVSEGILRQRWKILEGLKDGLGIGEKVIQWAKKPFECWSLW